MFSEDFQEKKTGLTKIEAFSNADQEKEMLFEKKGFQFKVVIKGFNGKLAAKVEQTFHEYLEEQK